MVSTVKWPMTTKRRRMSRRKSPTPNEGFRRRYPSTAWPFAVRAVSAWRSSGVVRTCTALLILCLLVRDAGIEERINEIEQEGGEPDGEDQNENDPLHDEEVTAANALIENAANSWIREHYLDKDRT